GGDRDRARLGGPDRDEGGARPGPPDARAGDEQHLVLAGGRLAHADLQPGDVLGDAAAAADRPRPGGGRDPAGALAAPGRAPRGPALLPAARGPRRAHRARRVARADARVLLLAGGDRARRPPRPAPRPPAARLGGARPLLPSAHDGPLPA